MHENKRMKTRVEYLEEILEEQKRTITALTGGRPSTDVIVQLARLEQRNLQLIFALQDAWTYVHGNCTINSVRKQVGNALRGEPGEFDAEVRRLRWIRDHLKITDVDHWECDALLKIEPCCFGFKEGTEPTIDAGIDMLIDEEMAKKRHGPWEHCDRDGNHMVDGMNSVAKNAKITEAEHQRDLLMKAIRDAAVKAGICREDADLTGPHLLMLLNDMAEVLAGGKSDES